MKREALSDVRWWKRDEDEAHEVVVSVAQRIREATKIAQNRMVYNARLFGTREFPGLPQTAGDAGPGVSVGPRRLAYNGVRSVVNGWSAKIAKARPRPLYLTRDGDYSLQRKAKQMTAFMEGVFHELDAYMLARRIVRDGAIFGTGLLKVWETGPRGDDHGRIRYDRTLPWELLVDPIEGFDGNPPCLYQQKRIDRAVLAEMFSGDDDDSARKRRAIEDASGVEDTSARDSVADQVEVFEAWHLPSAEGAKDGRHVIAIAEMTLRDDTEWARSSFPFAVYRFDQPLVGFHGESMIEGLGPMQYELNLTLEKIQRILHLCATPRVLTQRGSKIIKTHLTNEIGIQVEYDGEPPQFIAPPSVPPELMGHAAQLIEWMHSSEGVSLAFSQAQKPAGLNSGKAIRNHDDIETDRFAIQALDVEAFFMQLADLTIEEVQAITERDGAYRVKAPDGKRMQELDWRDISIERDAYIVRVFPTSMLPTTPAAKMESVQELVDSGFMGREDAMRLLDFPDIERFASLELAAYEIVDRCIERMIDEDESIYPEPYFPLDFAAKRVQQAYLRGKLDGVPEEALERMRQFIDNCQAEISKAQQGPVGAPAGTAVSPTSGLPPAMPTAPMDPAAPPPMPQGAPPLAA